MADELPELKGEMPQWVYLERIARELRTLRILNSELVRFMRDAEQEVPEKMRRFTNYMHDVHDITYMYEERGLRVPDWILREMERCDDRFRQVLQKEHTDGTFERVRREMAGDTDNRWDHTQQLTYLKPKENGSETR